MDSLGPIIATQVEAAVIPDAPNASAQANSGVSFGAHLASSNAELDALAQVEKVTLEIEAARRPSPPVSAPTAAVQIDVAAIAAAITAAIAIGRTAASDAEPSAPETAPTDADAPALESGVEDTLDIDAQPLVVASPVFEAFHAEVTHADAAQVNGSDPDLPPREELGVEDEPEGVAQQPALFSTLVSPPVPTVDPHSDTSDRVAPEGDVLAAHAQHDTTEARNLQNVRPAPAPTPDLAQDLATPAGPSDLRPAERGALPNAPITQAQRPSEGAQSPAMPLAVSTQANEPPAHEVVEAIELDDSAKPTISEAMTKSVDTNHALQSSSVTSEKSVTVTERLTIDTKAHDDARAPKIAAPEGNASPETTKTHETPQRAPSHERIALRETLESAPTEHLEQTPSVAASPVDPSAPIPTALPMVSAQPTSAPTKADESQHVRAPQPAAVQTLPDNRAQSPQRPIFRPASGMPRDDISISAINRSTSDVAHEAHETAAVFPRRFTSGELNLARPFIPPVRAFTTLEPSRPIPSWQVSAPQAIVVTQIDSAQRDIDPNSPAPDRASRLNEDATDDEPSVKNDAPMRESTSNRSSQHDKGASRPTEHEASPPGEASDDTRIVSETDTRRTLTEAQKFDATTQQAARDPRMRQLSEDLRARALERQVIAAAREGVDQIRMQLYPPGLGQIFVRVSLDGGKLKLQARTGSAEAADALRDIADALGEALNDSGFELTSFDVAQQDSEGDDRPRDEKKQPQAEKNASDFSIDVHV